MDTEGRRRSDNFEDRGAGGGRFGGGGAAPALLFGLVRTLGVKGTLVIVALVGGFYLFAPASLKQAIFGGGGDPGGSGSAASTCAASPAFGRACDFSRVVLASTEDVWSAEFRKGALPDYGRSVSTYRNPTLVVFSHGVAAKPVARLLGCLATRLGRYDEAELHFANARELAERMRAPFSIVRTLLDHADLCLVRGAPDDAQRMRDFATRALGIAQEFGLAGLETRANAMLASA